MNRLESFREALARLRLRVAGGEIGEEEYDRLKAKLLSELTPEERAALGVTPVPVGPSGAPPTRLESVTALELEPGQVLMGRWEVLETLGRGGFGVVVAARDRHLDGERVAVKVLDPGMVRRTELFARFKREVVVMRRLNHPRVVRVFDYWEEPEAGLALISMELVAGGSVRGLQELARARGEAVPVPAALAILRDVLEGLAAVHGAGVVHRDITPGNVLLGGAGPEALLGEEAAEPGAKLVDFGIARLADRTQLSQKSQALGTAAYVAPEVLNAEGAVGPAADVYSAGAVVYALLTGRLAQGRFRLPSEHRSGLPEGTDELLDAMLQFDPGDRPAADEALERARELAAAALEKAGPNGPVAPGRIVGTGSERGHERDGRRRSGAAPEPGASWESPAVGMRFRYVPPGEFVMGSPPEEPGRFKDERQHDVRITRGFWMGETAVTQGQWEAVIGRNPSRFEDGGDDCPVEMVSWYDAVKYANALSEKEGLEACYEIRGNHVRFLGLDRTGYRLPTEAEWEYAARAGTVDPFWTGRCLSREEANYDGRYPLRGCPKGKHDERTAPVRSFPANPWGLCEVHGNVWEWVWDWYGKPPGEAVTDPCGPDHGFFRVARGGGWNSGARYCRSANRHADDPESRHDSLGLRLARTALE